jgi:hypothetical protein
MKIAYKISKKGKNTINLLAFNFAKHLPKTIHFINVIIPIKSNAKTLYSLSSSKITKENRSINTVRG